MGNTTAGSDTATLHHMSNTPEILLLRIAGAAPPAAMADTPSPGFAVDDRAGAAVRPPRLPSPAGRYK